MLQEELKGAPYATPYTWDLSPYMQFYLLNTILGEGEPKILLVNEKKEYLFPNLELNAKEQEAIDDTLEYFLLTEDDDSDNASEINKPRYIVHGHGILEDQQPKFIFFPTVANHLVTSRNNITTGDYVELSEGTIVGLSDNNNFTYTPAGSGNIPDFYVTRETVILKAVKVVHNIVNEPEESVTEIFLTGDKPSTPIQIDYRGQDLTLVMCDCQSPESHDPLHIMNRDN